MDAASDVSVNVSDSPLIVITDVSVGDADNNFMNAELSIVPS